MKTISGGRWHGLIAGAALTIASATLATAAGKPIRALDGDDIAFVSPRISIDGLRAVAVRLYAENLTWPGVGVEVKWRDVVLLDLRSNCAEDIVQEVSRDGLSYGASIAGGDGAMVFYWREDGAGDHSLVRRIFSTGVETVLLTEEGSEPRSPGTSANGSWAAWIRLGSPAELVMADLSANPPTLTVADTADPGSFVLAHDRAVTDGGVLHYAKSVSGVRQLFRWSAGGGVVQLTTGSDPHGPPSVTRDGSLMAFWRMDGSVPDIFTRTSGGTEVQLTSNGDSSEMSWVTLTPDAAWVVFASTADLDGAADNSDGSNEIFRILADDTGSVEQLSNQTMASSREILVTGTSGSGRGHPDTTVFLYGASKVGILGATAGAIHEGAVHVATEKTVSDTLVDDWDPAETSVAPPFDIRNSVPGVSFQPCRLISASLRCTSWLRNSIDRARNLLLVPEWTFEGSPLLCGPTVLPEPRQVLLQAGEGAVVSSELPMYCAGEGSYQLRVIDLEVAQADLVQHFETFDF